MLFDPAYFKSRKTAVCQNVLFLYLSIKNMSVNIVVLNFKYETMKLILAQEYLKIVIKALSDCTYHW